MAAPTRSAIAGEYRGARRPRRPVPGRARSRRCGSISSATRSRACAASIPPPSAASAGSRASPCCPPPRPCSTRTASSASAPRYRELFGATATGDPLYQAVSDGRRLAGIDHWLPLVRGAAGDPVRPSRRRRPHRPRRRRCRRRRGALRGDRRLLREPRRARRPADPGSYRPLAPETLYLSREEWDGAGRGAAAPPRDPVPRARERDGASISGSMRPRDFAPERAQGANVYEAVVAHVAALRRAKQQGRAGQLFGRRARAAEGPARRSRPDQASPRPRAGRRRSAPLPGPGRARGDPARPRLHQRATSPCSPSRTCSATGSSAAASARKSADAFLSELATLTPGDLVVHADHGIGRYEGLTQIPVQQRAARLRRARICRRRQALRPGREYRHPLALRQRERRRRARPARRRGLAAAQVADEGADPRDRRRADQDRRRARAAARRGGRARHRLRRLRRPLPL